MKSVDVKDGVIRDRLPTDEEFNKVLARFPDLHLRAGPDGKIFDINQETWKKTLGWEPNQILGQEYQFLIHPDDLKHSQEVIQSASIQKLDTISFENRILTEAGEYKYFQWHASFDLTEGIFFATGRDISSFKISKELTLHDSASFLRAILDHLPIALFCKDIKNDYRFKLWNNKSESLFGLTENNIIGKSDYDLFPKEQADFFRSKDLECLKTGGIVDIPEEVINAGKPDAIYLHTKKVTIYDENKNAAFLLGIAEDITEKVNAKKDAKDKEQLLSDLAKNFPGILVRFTQLKDGGFITNFFGTSVQPFLGLNQFQSITSFESFLEMIKKEDLASLYEELKEANQSKRQLTWEGRIKSPQHSSPEQWVQLTCMPSLHPSQDTLWDGAILNITDRKRSEEVARSYQAKMAASSKMAVLGEMAGGIAHEINNPLAIIKGHLDQMEARLNQGKEISVETFLVSTSKMNRMCERIAKIISGLRSFSRNSEGDAFSLSPVKNIIEDSLELVNQKFKLHGIQVETNISNPHLRVQCRSSQLSQVLVNLLSNAFDAIKNMKNPWINVSLSETNDGVELTVTDSGHGIPQEIADRMMEPFYTTKEVGKGTGLGLSISKGIIEEHGGRIWLDRNSKNTKFVVRLPRFIEKQGELKQSAASDK